MIDRPELPPPTDRLSDLTEAEQLVVRALRRWLAGGEQLEMLSRWLAHELDAGAARAALKGLEATIRVLSAHASRNIAYHHPCCAALGADEAGLLTLVSAVQRGQHALARVVAANFVRPTGTKILLAAADMFAAALNRAGCELPLRYAYCEDDAADFDPQPVAAQTVH